MHLIDKEKFNANVLLNESTRVHQILRTMAAE